MIQALRQISARIPHARGLILLAAPFPWMRRGFILSMPALPRMRRSLILALPAAILSFGVHAQGGGSQAFSDLPGSWSGTGTVTASNGTTERIRCDAAYQTVGDGNTLRQALRCTSDSYRVDLRAEIQQSGNSLSGSWQEVSRNANGRITGQASPGRIQAVAQGPGFSATVNLTTRGQQQAVLIRAEGAEVSQVSVNLRKAGR